MLSALIISQLRGVDAVETDQGIMINDHIYPFVNHPPIEQPFFHVEMDQYWPIPEEYIDLFHLNHIVLASSNPGKIAEYQSFLKEASVSLVSHPDSIDVQEDKHTFYENALIKSRHAAQNESEGVVVLADDSGFCLSSVHWEDVDVEVEGAQGAFPGVYTKRFAKALNPSIDYRLASEWISNQFNLPIPSYFECSIAVSKRQGDLILSMLFRGQIHGQCVNYREGLNGFGFDPVFVPEGHEKTFSQMTNEEKSAISHRGIAMQALKKTFGIK
jgi:XTP/dITP diphosphohydrolase